FGSNPDSQFAEKSLSRIPFKVYLNTTINMGHIYGSEAEVVILPCAARDEEQQATTQESMFNFVRKSDGGIVRLDNVRSETDIICELALNIIDNASVDFSEFKKHKNIRKAIACTIPGFEKLLELEEKDKEFQIGGRTLHSPEFNTPDKKANFKVVDIPKLSLNTKMDFQLTTVRSEGQFNTIIYEEHDLFRDQTERWIVLMNKLDMKSRELKENDLVDIKSDTGKMERVKVREFDISRSCLLTYFPESNILISNNTDPRSKTPGFKSVPVNIFKIN
ncbi:MAG TPA: histidine kinase, partial [Flavobacteriales bacterium]|nr:histidine kinase [Flavobacteriales bacterium]